MADGSDTQTRTPQVFVSYAHSDASDAPFPWVLERIRSLTSFRDDLHVWSDADLELGSLWEDQILGALNHARVAVLLLGPGFFESNFIRRREMPELLLAARSGRLHLLPVAVTETPQRYLREDFKYPDPDSGPYRTSVTAFQGLLEPMIALTDVDKVSAMSEVEARILEGLQQHPADLEAGNSVLVIGSGLVENNLLTQTHIELDYKHLVERVRCYGGSGVNYATRLARIGTPVLPIISIGRDSIGKEIQSSLADASPRRYPLARQFIQDDLFLCDRIRSSETYIAIHEEQRTVFTEDVEGAVEFGTHFYNRLEAITETGMEVGAVMIGHLYIDHPQHGLSRCLTADIISEFTGRSLIFANFGLSQIARGSHFWRTHLENISVLQMTLQEALHFFEDNEDVVTVRDMIEWFLSADATVIITDDRYGAIGTLRGVSEVAFVHRVPIERVVDKTGAGDAFGSGVVHSLLPDPRLDRHSFARALERGRLWGAFACLSVGGSNGSPTKREFEKFEGAIVSQLSPVTWNSLADASFLEYLRTIEDVERLRRRAGSRGQ